MKEDLTKYSLTKKELKKIDNALKKIINTKGRKELKKIADRLPRRERPI